MDLTRKGERILETDCEEAFREVKLEDLRKLEKLVGAEPGRIAYRVYCGLKKFTSSHFPLINSDGETDFSRLTWLQALLCYEEIEDSVWRAPLNFGKGCEELLGRYLYEQELIE